MKASRVNLCPPVLSAIHSMGASSRNLVNALNSALGELEAHSEEGKLGDGRVTKTDYKVTETVTLKYKGDKTTSPLLFDAWHSAIAKAHKIVAFDSVSIPDSLREWVSKFIPAAKSETVPAGK